MSDDIITMRLPSSDGGKTERTYVAVDALLSDEAIMAAGDALVNFPDAAADAASREYLCVRGAILAAIAVASSEEREP